MISLTPKSLWDLKDNSIASIEMLAVLMYIQEPKYVVDILDVLGVSRRSLEMWVKKRPDLFTIEMLPRENDKGTGANIKKVLGLTRKAGEILERSKFKPF